MSIMSRLLMTLILSLVCCVCVCLCVLQGVTSPGLLRSSPSSTMCTNSGFSPLYHTHTHTHKQTQILMHKIMFSCIACLYIYIYNVYMYIIMYNVYMYIIMYNVYMYNYIYVCKCVFYCNAVYIWYLAL